MNKMIEELNDMDDERREALLTIMEGMGQDTASIRALLGETVEETVEETVGSGEIIKPTDIDKGDYVEVVEVADGVEVEIDHTPTVEETVEIDPHAETNELLASIVLKGNCIKCETEFEFLRKRGQKPKYCSDECRKPVIELKVRTYTCSACEQEFEMHGRGKLPKTCVECKIKPTIRIYTCDVCSEEGEQWGKGPLRKRHHDCKPEAIPAERAYVCDICGVEGIQYGIGKTRVRCDGCKPPIPTKTRTYTCKVCEGDFVMEGRGRLRTICTICVKPKSKKKVDTTVETEGIEQEVVETTQENTDVDDETQKALDILSSLMGN